MIPDEEQIMGLIKNTCGYHESQHKGEFLKGASVAIGKTLDIVRPIIQTLDRLERQSRKEYEVIVDELNTISKILDKHSNRSRK